MFDILIVGAGGFGRELMPWLPDCFPTDRYRVKGYLSQTPAVFDEREQELPVCGDPETYQPQPNDRFLLALGDVAARRRIVESLCSRGAEFLTMIHPTALVASSATIGKGVILFPYSALSNCATAEDFSVLSFYAFLGHDARVGRYCNLSPYATLNGFAIAEEAVFLGTHATIGPSVTIGHDSKICANTAALHNTHPNSFVFGVPGKTTPKFE